MLPDAALETCFCFPATHDVPSSSRSPFSRFSTSTRAVRPTNMATFRNIATQTEKEYRAITPLQLIEMIQKLTNMLSIGHDDMILEVRNQALHTLDLCFKQVCKQCCEEPPIYKDHPPVRDADLAEQIAPKGDPGTSTAPCGRSSDRGGVVQRDVSDHQRAAELL